MTTPNHPTPHPHAADHPATEHGAEHPAAGRHAEDRHAEDRPAEDRPAEDRPAGDRPKRLPANYQLVYDVVRSQAPGLHAPAGDIFTRAKAIKASLGYSTVYRALGRLCEMGLVLELHLPGMNAALYEQARSGHAHFVCRGCGWIEDVDCDVPADAIHSLVRGRDGEVDEIILTVHGRCTRCRLAAPEPAGLAAADGPSPVVPGVENL